MGITQSRTYGGQTAADRAAERRRRLHDATLSVIGEGGTPSVRGVLERSGVAPRYFYEEFADVDALQLAVFDDLIAEAEARGLAALSRAPKRARDRIRAVLAEMADFLLENPGIGRMLLVHSLGTPVLAPRRAEEIQRFAGLLAVHSHAVWRGEDPGSHPVRVTALFAMGGFAEAISAVLQGSLTIPREQLVDDVTELFVGAGTAYRRMTSRT